jgi:4-hydroxybenzoate polyprenyltransferase
MSNQAGPSRSGVPPSRTLWTVVAVLGGLAFALTALLGAPGLVYVIVAVCLGAAYSPVAVLTRQDQQPR